MLTAYGITDTGRVRQTNEDALFWSVDLGLFIVADGMGGHNAGEVASQLAVDTLRDCIMKSEAVAASAPSGADADGSLADRLETGIQLANTHVFNASQTNPDYSGMGTTVVAALVRGDALTYAGVGDSRVYSYLDGTLTQLTVDDSWVTRIRAEHPDITDEMIASNPLRHVLTNVIGAHADTPVDVDERTLTDGELLLLCSDGVYGPLEGDTLRALLAEPVDLRVMAERMITAALDAGSRDNVTVLLVRYQQDPPGAVA
jgi:PPM family protein phosphatase